MTTFVRTLVILRHAKAEPGDFGDDQLRALALDGRTQASRVGHQIEQAGFNPGLVLCSTALRTRQTWELASHGLSVEPVVEFRDDLYAASLTDVLDVIHGIDPEVGSVLLIGHEPSVSATATHLAGAGSDKAALAQVRAGVPTATYSVLRSTNPWDAWTADSAVLAGVFRG